MDQVPRSLDCIVEPLHGGQSQRLTSSSSQHHEPASSLTECLRSSVPRWSFLPASSSLAPKQNYAQRNQRKAAFDEYGAGVSSSNAIPSPRRVGTSTTHRTSRRLLSMQCASSRSSVIDGRYSPAATSMLTSMDDPVLEGTSAAQSQQLPTVFRTVPAGCSRAVTTKHDMPLTVHPTQLEELNATHPATAGRGRSRATIATINPPVAIPFSPRTLQHSSASLHHRNRAALPEAVAREQAATRRKPQATRRHDRELVVGDEVAVEADSEYPIASIPFLSTRDPGEQIRWNRGNINRHASDVDADNTPPFDVGGVSWSDESPARGGAGDRRGQRRDPKRLMDVSPTRRTGRVVFLDPGLGGLLFDATSVYIVRFHLEDLVLQAMTVLSLGDVLSYNRVQEGADAYRAVRLVRISTRDEEESKKPIDRSPTEGGGAAPALEGDFAEGAEMFTVAPCMVDGVRAEVHPPKRPSLLAGIEYRSFFTHSKRRDTKTLAKGLFRHSGGGQEDDDSDDIDTQDVVVGRDDIGFPKLASGNPISLLTESDEDAPRGNTNNNKQRAYHPSMTPKQHEEDDETRHLGKQMMQLSRTNPEWLLDEVEREFDDEVHRSIHRAAAAAASERRHGKGGLAPAGPVSLYDLNENRATDDAVRHFMELSEVPVAVEFAALEKRRREYRWYSSHSWEPAASTTRRFPRSVNVFERLAGRSVGVATVNLDGVGEDADDPDELGAPDSKSPNASDAFSEDDDASHTAHGGATGRPNPRPSSGSVAAVTRAFEKERRQIAQVNVRKFVEGVDLEPQGTAKHLHHHKDLTIPLHQVVSRFPSSKEKEDRPSPRVWK
jgi:hypothetical protein